MRSMTALLGLALLAGCASTGGTPILGTDPSAWETLLRGRGVQAGAFPDPLETTEEMRETAAELAGRGKPREQLARLQAALFDRDRFPFEYTSSGTYTAREAFNERRGNCLSFTNLFIALSRSLDIPVQGAFPVYLGRSEKEGDLVLVNTHVVAAYRHVNGVEVYDFDRAREGPNRPVRFIDDPRLAALYLNNKGVEELRLGRVTRAEAYLEGAVALDPEFAGAWGNLGVIRRRSGDIQGAFEAYGRALDVAPSHPTVLTNLAGLYRLKGREREARMALTAADLSQASPHVLIVRGDIERSEGNAREALRYYKRAHRLDRKHPDPLVSMAQAEGELGRPEAARRNLERALKRDPENAEARRMLEELGQG